ncbi:MAG: diguanylate cyclase [Dermatophilaceae bacterium]
MEVVAVEVVEVVEVIEVVETVEVVEVVAAEAPAPTEALPDPETDQAFRALFDASPSGLAELRDDGTFVRVNDAFCRLVGRTWDSLRDTVYEALIHHEDRASAFVSRTRRETDGAPVAPNEHRLLHSDGSVVWVRARTSPIDSAEGPRLLVSLDNVTAARAREAQLTHDALHDSLTGLPNRRLVLDRLERAVSRARRGGQRLAVFFIDVDDLKHVNDTHPWQHKAGDVLLTSIAVAMRGALRETDALGRLAGDEFLVICEEVGDDVAVSELAERLLDAARQPVPLGPQTHHPTVSIGLAVSSEDDETAEELLSRADSAMYVAKSHGGGRVERADELTSASMPDLVGALARSELRMQYQPVVSLATGAVLGMAAVLRWQHPTLGMLPAHQVRTALDSAAVLPVVDWCIDRAINDVRTVAPTRVDHVSVWLPVPGRAVQATSTRDALRAAVRGADGSQTPDTSPSLVLDVHETDLAALARRPSLRRQLAALTETGPVALGVEHLSADVLPVGALQLLGAASVSVDPELVLAASENESGEALVRSLVTGATAVGVVTVATGISSPELLEEARRLGVHAVSGDLIGPAASLEVYSDLLHGERVTLPGAPEVTIVRPFDDEDYIAPGRPMLSAIRALEEDSEDDLLAEALRDDEDADAEPWGAPADSDVAPDAAADEAADGRGSGGRARRGGPALEPAAARRRRRPGRAGGPRARRRAASARRGAAARCRRGTGSGRRRSAARPDPAAPAGAGRPARRARLARGHPRLPRPVRAERQRAGRGRRSRRRGRGRRRALGFPLCR